VSECLPFERVMTYQEFAFEHDGDSESPRLDVACPECGWVLRVVDDDVAVGHWYLACPCGWREAGAAE
jgi:hypothetical protein